MCFLHGHILSGAHQALERAAFLHVVSVGWCPSWRIPLILIEGDNVLLPLVYFTLLVCSVFFVNLPYLFEC